MKPARLLTPLFAAILLAACSSSGIESKEAIRLAMVEYLNAHTTETGLDPSTMDINVDAVVFEREVARATVSFLIKGSTQGMQMNYVLDRKGDKWVTRSRPSKGAPHPAIEDENTKAVPDNPSIPIPSQGGQLPAGHPPLDAPAQGKTK